MQNSASLLRRLIKGSLLAFITVIPISSQPIAAQDTEIEDSAPAANIAAPAGSVGGLGDVNLFPRRVVLQGRRQISTVGLYNKTTTEGDYEIQIVDMAMTPDGRLLAFDNGVSAEHQAKVKVASNLLRYSPRRVTLRGSESQTVRVMARASADLPPGEYRSHFTVVSVPRTGIGGFSIEQAMGEEDTDGIGVTIRPRFGISIPVIIRIGETTLEVGIRDVQLLTARDGTQAFGFTLTRSGTRSAYGDIAINARGAPEPLAVAKGIGVYPEIDSRRVIIPIDPETDPAFLTAGQEITITYVDDDFEPGSTLTETTFRLP